MQKPEESGIEKISKLTPREAIEKFLGPESKEKLAKVDEKILFLELPKYKREFEIHEQGKLWYESYVGKREFVQNQTTPPHVTHIHFEHKPGSETSHGAYN